MRDFWPGKRLNNLSISDMHMMNAGVCRNTAGFRVRREILARLVDNMGRGVMGSAMLGLYCIQTARDSSNLKVNRLSL